MNGSVFRSRRSSRNELEGGPEYAIISQSDQQTNHDRCLYTWAIITKLRFFFIMISCECIFFFVDDVMTNLSGLVAAVEDTFSSNKKWNILPAIQQPRPPTSRPLPPVIQQPRPPPSRPLPPVITTKILPLSSNTLPIPTQITHPIISGPLPNCLSRDWHVKQIGPRRRRRRPFRRLHRNVR